MKIAILIPGHLRAWEYCKQNFIEMLYDKQHQIDIFVDTYFQQFRIDCNTYDLGSYQKETQLNITLSHQQISNLFSHLKVVSLQIEDEHEVKKNFQQNGMWDEEQQKPIDGLSQLRKLHRIEENLKKYEALHGVYDLVVKTRPDIIINEKINYHEILGRVINFPRLIACGKGFSSFPNDMLNIGSSDSIHSILQRKNIDISRDSCEESIDISVIRLDRNIYFDPKCCTTTGYFINGIELIVDNTSNTQRLPHVPYQPKEEPKRLKIAVLIPGHFRTWTYCKENFIQTICDSNHQIDIFVDTYNCQYRANRELKETNSKQIILDKNLIDRYLGDFNVVAGNVTDDDELDIANFSTSDWLPLLFQYHTNKLFSVTNMFIEYEQTHYAYDLVVKTRFDVLLEDRLDYQMYYNKCKDNDSIVFGGTGIHVSGANDIFAIGNSAAMKKYGLRSKITNRIEIFEHDAALCNFVVDPHHKIPLSLVRLADNDKAKIESFIPTRHSIPTD